MPIDSACQHLFFEVSVRLHVRPDQATTRRNPEPFSRLPILATFGNAKISKKYKNICYNDSGGDSYGI